MSATWTAEGEEDASTIVEHEQPVPRDDNPNLYNFPSSFHPVYRPLPILVNLIVVLVSMFVSAITTWQNLTWLDQLMSVHSRRVSVKKLLKFAGKAIVAGFLSKTVIQDIFLPPTRISTVNLVRDFFLPSSFSRYEPISLPGKESMGVHYLQCQSSQQQNNSTRFQALYFNHGFGASSLSWLPVMPSLLKRMGGRVALAHDAPGFGFTDRPNKVTAYTRGTSAEIGSSILQSSLQEEDASSIALFGHSMGAAATLRMALALPEETRKFIVLVGPALGLMHEPSKIQSRLRALTRPVRQLVRKYLFDPSFSYVLKRAVGTPNFWKNGLRKVWGNPSRLSDSDVLRFQWPSVGQGWERGLLSFALAQSRQGSSDGKTDAQLMEQVLALPNTTVIVIRGGNDRVVPKQLVDKFFDKFPDVPIYELQGQGHDPFEEQVDVFVETVGTIVDKENA
jgi:pimeloyl-ACP methyl ester carboxylesterase